MVSDDVRRYLIIAGNAREAEQYRVEHDLTRQQIVYVGTESSLRGMTLDDSWTIVRVGSGESRRDMLKIEESIRIASLASTTSPRQINYETTSRARHIESDA